MGSQSTSINKSEMSRPDFSPFPHHLLQHLKRQRHSWAAGKQHSLVDAGGRERCWNPLALTKALPRPQYTSTQLTVFPWSSKLSKLHLHSGGNGYLLWSASYKEYGLFCGLTPMISAQKISRHWYPSYRGSAPNSPKSILHSLTTPRRTAARRGRNPLHKH